MEREFIKAVKTGNIKKALEMLSNDASLAGYKDYDGTTALHAAAWKGHIVLVKELLKAGADVHAENTNTHWGTTALHAAAHANNAAIVTVLLEAGARVSALDTAGKTPLYHTTFHRAAAAAKVLEEHGGVIDVSTLDEDS